MNNTDEIAMLHNVINEYKKEIEKLKEEHKDFIDWDEEEYIQNIADLKTEIKNIKKHQHGVFSVGKNWNKQVNKDFKEENEKLKAREDMLKDVLKCSDEEVTIQRNRATQIKHKLHQSQAENEKLRKVISEYYTVKTKSPGDVFDNATKKLDELHEQICQTETDYFKKLKEDPNWECGFK